MFDYEEDAILIGVRVVGGALTLIGSSLMVALILLLGRYHHFPQRILLWLSVATGVGSLPDLLGNMSDYHFGCQLQGFSSTFSDWSTAMWTICLALNLYFVVAWEIKKPKRLEKFYHLGCWIPSITLSCLPFYRDAYGSTGTWCWIKETEPALRFGIWYIPLFAFFFGVTLLVFLISRALKNSPTAHSNPEEFDVVNRLRLYPIIFLICWVFPLANRIQNFINPGHPNYFLVLMHCFLSPLQGFLTAVVYCFERNTVDYLIPSRCFKLLTASKSQRATFQEYHAVPISDAEADEYTSLTRHQSTPNVAGSPTSPSGGGGSGLTSSPSQPAYDGEPLRRSRSAGKTMIRSTGAILSPATLPSPDLAASPQPPPALPPASMAAAAASNTTSAPAAAGLAPGSPVSGRAPPTLVRGPSTGQLYGVQTGLMPSRAELNALTRHNPYDVAPNDPMYSI